MTKAVHAIDLIARAHLPVRLGDVAEALGMPKSSAHRLLTELAAHDMLRRDDTGRFLLGPRLLSWGVAAELSYDLRGIAEPHMRQLSHASGESVNLHVIQADHRVCIAAIRGAENLFPPVSVGEALPLGIGASGKVLLAFCSEPLQDQVIASLSAAGGPAPTREQLRVIRTNRWATSIDEQRLGLSAGASVIIGPGGRALGALAIGGDVDRFPPDRLEDLRTAVVSSAQAISAQVTGRTG
ncbi:IclR family transcriptional regulator [Aeromicrobium wangtongii]|uniref:IclR family transcriptional regulator n=1 Tax=Aeromicrobium wangtongii TaxID=2969247 RepID=UPI00201735E8|nr:IclR family transcriptional regulator [Aeromicrobium wangtongii]MCL3820380.1 IclR family transcriptional regulator [Aeromicrobium wangtongii]